jgi:signal transduction histidine kinase
VRRLSLWLRRHPVVGDSVIAVLVLGLLSASGSHQQFPERHPVVFWAVAVLMVGPVVFRRRWPIVTAYVIAAGGLVQMITFGGLPDPGAMPASVTDLALGIALYTLVVYTDRRAVLIYVAVLLVGTGVDLWWRVQDQASAAVLGIGALLVYAFSWALGEFAGARRAYHSEVEARLRLLETERDQQATIAVVAERTRIARELHDVVAHAVSVIVVQADGAGYAIRTDPELAESAVRTISETGREALIELRRLLEVLRSDTDERDQRAPQPGVAVVPELVDKFRVVGLPVELTVRGEMTDLPVAVGLGAYRIVQESLTNTLKHAGPGAHAEVRIERVGGLVEVEVSDDGGTILSWAGAGTARHLAVLSGGNGLIGMRERATVLGGTLTAGQAHGGGWRVRATFPVRTTRDTEPTPT